MLRHACTFQWYVCALGVEECKALCKGIWV